MKTYKQKYQESYAIIDKLNDEIRLLKTLPDVNPYQVKMLLAIATKYEEALLNLYHTVDPASSVYVIVRDALGKLE